MLNFDESRYLRIQSGAVGLADQIDSIVSSLLDRGADRIVFAGAGGAGLLMRPAASLLASESSFPVHVVRTAELVVTGFQALDAKSIVVIPSLSGTTPESIEAMAFCHSKDAAVIVLTAHEDTPLGQGADYCLTNFAEDDTSSESFYLQSLLMALSIMSRRGECTDYAEVVAALTQLPALLIDVKRAFEATAEKLADQLRDEPYHIFTGAGLSWPEAWYYGMCILEEMQWIRTRPVHASDFFHGTLELVEPGVSVVLLRGECRSRELTARVERFASAYTDKLTVVDSADAALPGVSARVRGLISQVVLAAMLERLSAHLEVRRNHPLVTRRYYRRVNY